MRLDKLLSTLGMSRAEAKKAISGGRVTVNGVTARDAGMHVEPSDAVLFDGAPAGQPGHTHLMLNKPAGVITAMEDASCETVLSLIPEKYRARGLCAVGRLDKDTTGILLLTTDGQLAHRLISPRWEVEKTYEAVVEGVLDEADAQRMACGVPLKDFTAKPAKMTILSVGADESVAELTVTEGKYHQVKRMFGALGHSVTRLHRRSVGPVPLDPALAPGQCRLLSAEEAGALYALTQLG